MAAAALRALRQSLPPSLLTHLVGDADAIAITARPTEYDLALLGEERSAATDTADDGGFVFHHERPEQLRTDTIAQEHPSAMYRLTPSHG